MDLTKRFFDGVAVFFHLLLGRGRDNYEGFTHQNNLPGERQRDVGFVPGFFKGPFSGNRHPDREKRDTGFLHQAYDSGFAHSPWPTRAVNRQYYTVTFTHRLDQGDETGRAPPAGRTALDMVTEQLRRPGHAVPIF